MAFYQYHPAHAMFGYPPAPPPPPGMGYGDEYYGVPYPPHSGGGPVFYEQRGWSHYRGGGGGGHRKFGYNNRKISTDSGISAISSFAESVAASSEADTLASEVTEADDDSPYESPDDELCEKIVEQVEFYFSDANISKDKFLLKHVRRNKEGFVSLKLVSSFKRVKHLTRDWRQVVEAVERKSRRLEVNDQRTKVRRVDPLPKYDETAPSRTVVAVNLPLERPTIEGVAEIFSACGEIVLIRILRPGNPIPADIRPFVNRHPEVSDKVCAVIEFEFTAFAHRAVKELNQLNSTEGKMSVMELTEPPRPRQQQPKPEETVSSKPEPRRRFSHAGLVVIPQRQVPGAVSYAQHAVSANRLQPASNSDDLALGSSRNGNGAVPRRRSSLQHDLAKFNTVEEEELASNSVLNPNAPTFRSSSNASSGRPRMEAAASGLSLPANVIRLPRGPEAGAGKGFQQRQRKQKKKETKEVTFAEAEAEVKVVMVDSGNEEDDEDLFEDVDLADEVDDNGGGARGISADDVNENEKTR